MSEKKSYHSILAPFILLYLEEQAKKGIKESSNRVSLMSFDEYLESIDYKSTIVTEKIYKDWFATQEHLKGITLYAKSCHIIRFLKFMNELGYGCHIPRPPKAVHCEFVPYVFSEDEIARIMKATDEWRDPTEQPNSSAMVMPAVIRLLYSTGMRVGEAIAINNRDVNFERHVIHVRNTKNKCERLSPVNESLEKVLRQYISYRDRMPLCHVADPEAPLFVNLRGERCREANIRYRFRLILDKACIQTTSSGYKARVHDIRHTACVHSMSNLAKSGMDIYCSLPLLANFMGHLHVKDTEYYVRLTRDMYPDLIKQDVSVTNPIRDIIKNATTAEINGTV